MNDMRDVFRPEDYLHYFDEPDGEDKFSLQFWSKHIQRLPRSVRVLEYGGGPALYGVLPLAHKAASIHFSDYVPANLDAVRAWIKGEPGAFNWNAYTQLILELEGARNDANAIAQREAKLRRAITRISEGDARTSEMLADAQPPYDVIGAHHCLDVAARDLDDFKRMLSTLNNMLATGGLFLLSVTTGTTDYTVDHTVFRCLDLSETEVRDALIEAGFATDSITCASMSVQRAEYTGVLLHAAWKK